MLNLALKNYCKKLCTCFVVGTRVRVIVRLQSIIGIIKMYNRNRKSITIFSLRSFQFIQPEKKRSIVVGEVGHGGGRPSMIIPIHTEKNKGEKGEMGGGWAEEINESVVLWLLQSSVLFGARVFGGAYPHIALTGKRVKPPPPPPPVENYFQIFSNSPMPKSF
jgi:hypothetical protein